MMDSETKLCNNCKKDISVSNFTIHSAFCERKLQICNQCDEAVPRSEMDRHMEESHTMDSCSCCSMPMEKWMLEKHKEICFKRPVSCKYCEIVVAMDELEDHHLYCGSRTEMCPSCKQYVMLAQMDTHSKICLEKSFTARNAVSPPNDVSELSNYTSSSSENSKEDTAYKLVSGAIVHSVKSSSFDSSDIPSKISSEAVDYETLVFCEYCQLQLPFAELRNHYLYCGLQKEKCHICNQYVLQREMDRHSKICQKHYFRTERSAYDMSSSTNSEQFSNSEDVIKNMARVSANRKIVQDQHIEKFFCCEYCKTKVTLTELEDHLLWCGSRTEKCHICERDISIKEMNTHSQNCKKGSFKYLGECHICKQNIPWVDMNEHIPCCASANGKCSRCGSDVPENKLKEHILRLCPELKKESVFMRNCEDSISENEENKVSYTRSFIYPENSKEEVESSVMTDYTASCPPIFYKCSLCSELVLKSERNDHETFLCKVLTLQEEADMSLEEMSEAACAIEEFKKRKISAEDKTEKCPYCNNNIPVVRYETHLSFCWQNVEECQFCELVIKEATVELHLEKCTAKNKFPSHHKGGSSMNTEEKLKLFKNEEFKAGKAHLETNVEKCPCCDLSILRTRFEEHLSCCLSKTKECKFCGMHFNVVCEKMHLQECSRVKSDSAPFCKKDKKRHKKAKKKNSLPESKVPATFIEPNPSKHTSRTFKDEVLIPCEFCQKMFSPDYIIEHESGCRPDLVSFPKEVVEAQGAIRKINARNWNKKSTFDVEEGATIDRVINFEEHKSTDACGGRKQGLIRIDRESTPPSTYAIPGEFLEGYTECKEEHEVASSDNSTYNAKMNACARRTGCDNLKLHKEIKACNEKILCSSNTGMVPKAEADIKNQNIKYLDFKDKKNSYMNAAEESYNSNFDIKSDKTGSCINEKNFTNSSESSRLKPCVEVLSKTDKEKIDNLKNRNLEYRFSSSSEDEDLEECIKFLKSTEVPDIGKQTNICVQNEVYNDDASTRKKLRSSYLSAIKVKEVNSEITDVHSAESNSSKGARMNENDNLSEYLSEHAKYLTLKEMTMEMTSKYNSVIRPSSNNEWNKWRSK
ncbi:TRAF-type zinc finger domain-containing protein 1, partial [Stegodyphus mimosarum]